MPYKSDKQRRWAHTDSAKKAGFPTEEFDKASKGMADGGEVKGDDFMEKEKEGFKNGINGDWENLKNTINGFHEKYISETEDKGIGTLEGLKSMLKPHAPADEDMQEKPTWNIEEGTKLAPNMADGGDISDAFRQLMNPIQSAAQGFMPAMQNMGHSATQMIDQVNPLMNMGLDMAASRINAQRQPPAPAPQVTPIQPSAPQQPSMSDAANSLNNIPPTNYDVNQGISADDRAAMIQKLLQQRSSPGNLVASGAAGLGDAIANSFGGQHTKYQQGIRDMQDKNIEQQGNVIDTQRQQRQQDLQANVEAQMNDPQSRISQSMQKTLKAAGVNVPSGMSGALMLKVAGPLAEMAKAKAAQEEAHFGHEAGIAEKGAQISEEQKKLEAEHPIQKLLGMLPGQQSSHSSGAKITRIN